MSKLDTQSSNLITKLNASELAKKIKAGDLSALGVFRISPARCQPERKFVILHVFLIKSPQKGCF